MKLLSLACLFCLATLGACMSASLQEALDALNDHLDGKSTDMDSQVADNNKELTEEELKAAGINTDGKNTQFMLDLDEQGNDAKSDETNIPDDIREAEEGRSDIAVTELYSEGQMDEDKVKEPVIIDQAGEGDKEPVENLGPNMLAMNPNIPDAFAASDREQQNPNFANADNNADAEEPVPDDDDDDFNFDDMVANEQGAQNKETQGGGEDRTTDEDADEPVANNEDFNFPDMGADAQGMQKNVPQGNGEDRATGEGAQSADSQGTAGDFVLNSYDRD